MLTDHGIRVSMNGVSSWYDNAPMESFFGTLKSELVHHYVYQSETMPELPCASTSRRSTIYGAVIRLWSISAQPPM